MPQMPPLSDQALKELLSRPIWAKIATTSPKGSLRITPIGFAAQPGRLHPDPQPEAEPEVLTAIRH